MTSTSTGVSDSRITFAGRPFSLAQLPGGVGLRPDIGLVVANTIDGAILHRWPEPNDHTFEVRATITPGGDYLAAVCAGSSHYGGQIGKKTNDLIAYRSKDKGKTWTGGKPLWEVAYNQHGFLPLIPRGSKRIYSLGTEPHPDHFNGVENAAIAYRYSDDDGYTWSAPTLIRPKNDPDFLAMSVIRPTETDRGTWLLGSHTGEKYVENKGADGKLAEGEGKFTARTRQYILRSEDRGKTWELIPGPRPNGWFAAKYDRMDELCPMSLGNGEVYALTRTSEGHLWELRSMDDGKTWTDPRPSPLVHPDSPAMLFKLSDGKTLAAFHHNRHTGGHFNHMDRSELWVSLSSDGGRSWGEPRFLAANAAPPTERWGAKIANLAYVDLLLDDGKAHLFVPHLFRQVVHLWFDEELLRRAPTRAQIQA